MDSDECANISTCDRDRTDTELHFKSHGPLKGKVMNIKINTNRLHNLPLAGAAAVAIALSAGSSIALAVDPDKTASSHEQSHDSAQWLTFVASDTVMGAEVMGSDRTTQIGTVNDLVIDRGTGRIVFAIIGHGGLLNVGQDLFATEFNRLSYSKSQEQFAVNMTKEQVDRQIEFLPENWKDLGHSNWMENFKEFITEEITERYGDSNQDKMNTKEVQGTVTKVSREEFGEHEDVVLTVKDSQGKSHKVILGPSWFIMGSDNSPSVNDRVELVTTKHHGKMIATQANIAGHELKLRDGHGNYQWKVESQETPRFVLLSDLIGKDIEIGGTTGGEIQNAVIETTSGRVPFFGFDPNDNLFGLADEISMVPWAAIQISPDLTVWSDSDDSEFSEAMAFPDDLSTLRTKMSVRDAYAPFGMQTPSFEMQKQSKKDTKSSKSWERTGNAWINSSELTYTFANGKKVQVNGEFIKTETIKLQNGTVSATAMWLKTADGKQQVILGPTWFIKHQDFDMNRGNSVKITGRETTIDGQRYIAAWNLEHDTNTWTLWNDSTPVWVD